MAAETEVERMVVRLMGDGKSYQQMLKTASASTTAHMGMITKSVATMGKAVQASLLKAGTALRAFGTKLQGMGRSMMMRVTMPLAIMGGMAAYSFGKFDQAMTESTSIMKVTEAQTAKMRDTALSLSGVAAQAPAELARSYFYLASAGKNAAQSMALLPAVTQFATAGAFDMALATDLLTDAQSALGMSSKNVATDTTNLLRISDALVKANTQANASVQQFAESLTSDAATASRMLGMELETTMAILALYADKGKKAAESGNLFGRATRLLTKLARDNAKVFSSMNIRVIDEATGKYRNFIDILDDMNKAFAGKTKPEIGKALAGLGFEPLAQKSILPLLGATEQLKKYESEQRDVAGTTKDVAEKQMKSFANQMKLVKNQLTILSIEIGEILAPMLEKLGEYIKQGVTWWRALSPEIKKTAVIIGIAAAALGPLLIGFGLLTAIAGAALTGFSVVLGAIGSAIAFVGSAVSVALGLVGSAIGVLLTPLGVVVTTLGVIAASFIRLDLASMWDGGKEAISRFASSAKGFIANFKQNMQILFAWFTRKWDSLVGFVSGIWQRIKSIVAEAVQTIIKTVFQLFPSLEGLWDGVSKGAIAAWSEAMSFVRQFVSGALGFLANFSENIGILWGFVRDNWRNILTDMVNLVIVFANNSLSNLGVAVGMYVRLWTAWQGWLVGMFKRLFSFQVVDAVLTGLIKIGEKIRDWAKAAWETIKAIFSGKMPSKSLDDFINQAKKDFDKGAEDINFVETAANIIKEESGKFKNPLEGFQSSLEQLPKFNLKVGNVDLPQFVFDQADKAGKEAGTALLSGISAAWEQAKSLFSGLDELDEMVEEATKPITVPVKFNVIKATEIGSMEFFDLASRMGAPKAPSPAAGGGGGGVPKTMEAKIATGAGALATAGRHALEQGILRALTKISGFTEAQAKKKSFEEVAQGAGLDEP